MGAITINVEAPSSVPAQTMYKGFLLDMDNLIPKILPQAVKSIKILEGDGGVGTIKLATLGEMSQFDSLKQRVDAIDKDALTYSYSIIEGEILLGKLESITSQFTVMPTEGGCIVKNTTKYTPIGDAVIPKENIEEATDKSALIFKAVEAYLIANPGAY